MPPRSQTDIADDTNFIALNGGASAPHAVKDNDLVLAAPWYRRGGMEINMIGMAFNISIPLVFLLQSVSEEWLKMFATTSALCIVLSAVHMRTIYCIAVVPIFVSSLSLAFTLIRGETWSETLKSAFLALALGILLAIMKVNICMSVCLHRYAAHHAFKCGGITSFLLQVIGCMANQGGPIWWASQHRCHHKYCDLPNDPHSPILMGIENAFGFFEIHQEVNEKFVPRHLDSVLGRVLDTWSFLIVSLELCAAYSYWGRLGLFLSYTSGWICQSITLWFNVLNHPPNYDILSSNSTSIKDKCQASDDKPIPFDSYYPPFYLLTMLHPLFALFVMEGEHKHHHDHAQLAKRSWYDIAYWGFVKPLEVSGLIYDVQI